MKTKRRPLALEPRRDDKGDWTMLRPEEIYAIMTLMRGASLLLALVFALKIAKHFILTL